MHAPDFVPRRVEPLEYYSIGSGGGSTCEITRTADCLLASMPGNDMIEGLAITEAVSEFIANKEIDDVGGMFTCVKVDKRHPRARGGFRIAGLEGLDRLRSCIGTLGAGERSDR
jgi:hypothetical protein